VRRTAVIDMGSNSFRLVVYGHEPGGPWMLTDEIREPVRVSAGMGDGNELRRKPMERALRTAEVFAAFCRASGIDDVIAVGTSAFRDAGNSPQLLRAIAESTGIEARVLSGPEEARYGYLAIANSTTLTDGFGLDMGGGSIQLVELRNRELTQAKSLPLGAVRVSERFLPGGKANGKAMKALRGHVGSALDSLDWFAPGDGAQLAGIGGGLRNLATAAQKRAGYPDVGGVQGYAFERAALEELIEELASKPVAKRGAVPGIKPDRGDVILGTALVLAGVMDHGGFHAITVCEAGLREGIFFERFLQGVDPPLLEDVRRQSVENLGRRFHFEPRHVDHVAKLSLEMYDGLAAAGLVDPSEEDRELMWAACMLHDVGVTIDYDDHHKHSQYLILHAGLPGFTPRELALIALIARYHRKGDPDVSELGPLARKDDPRLVSLLAALIRLAEQLERSRDQAIGEVRVSAADGRVELEARAVSDGEVALWSARRSSDLLARALDLPVEISRGA
jgi:exopolyphosphatase / guanosine-5'-triphosphate,3'-diphosphate pyrophosphatase